MTQKAMSRIVLNIKKFARSAMRPSKTILAVNGGGLPYPRSLGQCRTDGCYELLAERWSWLEKQSL